MDDSDPITRAIKWAGSEAKLGSLIGCSQVAINKAKKRGKVSAEMAVAIDDLKDCPVSKQELRPDLFKAEEAQPCG
jgi:DNA-binding transcriptional regulator YdaS (Cro superfamily)